MLKQNIKIKTPKGFSFKVTKGFAENDNPPHYVRVNLIVWLEDR